MDSLVSTHWLAENLGTPGLVILDASKHLPAANRDPRAEFEAAHIVGARFLDLDSLVDATSSVPQALPRADQLAQRLAELDVDLGDRIVLYDDSAVKTAARAWFALTAHGIDAVSILDGGLSKWRTEGRPLENGASASKRSDVSDLPNAVRVRSKSDMLDAIGDPEEQILDARAADRVFGTGIDPVHGGQNGRIPGSLNLPYGQVFQADGTFKPPADLKAAFETAGIDLTRSIVTSCGSGLTASVLLFALHLIGKDDTALYDGSWMEWEADPSTPKAQGPE